MSDLQDLLVAPNASIEDAIRGINAGAIGIVLVTNGSGKLLGTVTDGDVRRAIIRKVNMSEPVSRIMNSAPRVVHVGATRDEILAVMYAHRLLQIPIVDDAFRVVAVETLQGVGEHPRVDNWVLIMAGGYGTRLRPLTDTCPKPMLRVAGKPVLETILENFLSHGFHRFQIAVHYMADVIKNHFGDGSKWNATIRYVEEEKPLGTAGGLSLFKGDRKLPLVVMNADILTRMNFVDLIRFHDHEGAAATMCARGYDYQVPYGVIEAHEHVVRRIIEKPVQTFFVNAGIYVVSPNVVRLVPKGHSLDMPDLLQHLIDRGDKVALFPLHEYWLDIGQMADLDRATLECGNGVP
ncbi:MAG: nucleotidyltransferase family protein [Alphaproteobacteria bacterium]|nr:nucleotidyltransferase family protein [Alphaproteobacteria bacterium]